MAFDRFCIRIKRLSSSSPTFSFWTYLVESWAKGEFETELYWFPFLKFLNLPSRLDDYIIVEVLNQLELAEDILAKDLANIPLFELLSLFLSNK